MGHAAGLAAVQVVRDGRSFAEVDVRALREALKSEGAIVDWEEEAEEKAR
jgi:hypothetical protein